MVHSNNCMINKWDKVFKNGASKICGRYPLKNLKGYGLYEDKDNNSK